MTGLMMRKDDVGRAPGPGEAAARAQRKRMWITIGALAAAGLPIGFFAALLEEDYKGGIMTGTLPAWFAILAAATFVIAVVAGTIVLYRRVDELERRDNMMAGAVGANVMCIAYPVWFVVWKGGLVQAPDALYLFLATLGSTLISYLYLKLKNQF
ncbi:MAG TPA: hypothetical protein VF695_03300 [Sphingomonas sp.]